MEQNTAKATVAEHPRSATARLTPARLQLAEQRRVIHLATVPAGTTPEQVLNPDYWAHVAARLRPLDRIEVRPEDLSFLMDLVVVSANRLQARVVQLSLATTDPVQPEEMESPPDAEHEVKWGGVRARFRIIRLHDKSVVRDGFETKAAAEQYLAEHIKALRS